MKSQSDLPAFVDGIQLTSWFNFKDLKFAITILRMAVDTNDLDYVSCHCCELSEVSNVVSGRTIFICPKGCSCHD